MSDNWMIAIAVGVLLYAYIENKKAATAQANVTTAVIAGIGSVN
jgi:hypothetical protein